MKEIVLGGRVIGPTQPPFIVAEMSGNHNQSLDRALAIVDAAADAGAHALKIQTYTPDTMTVDSAATEFNIADTNSLWRGKSLYQLYGEAFTPWQWHEPIFERCRRHNMVGFSTPFDSTAVDFLEELNVPAYKIASFECTDLPLIRRVAATRKPVIISIGMATVAELDETVRTCRQYGCDNLILLKCTSSYPALPVDSNLRTIPHLRALFDVQVGLSDHTLGFGAATAAIALGATFIEKHVTLNRADGGVDSAFSLEPSELRTLVQETERAWQALGKIQYGPTESEKKSLQFRRSLYIVKDLRAGEQLSADNVRSIRPGLGLEPKFYDVVLGRRVTRDIARGTALSWELVG
ncbi:MAG: pseudaminic acid synthase [Candidatus Zixiibacteriota bacterium]